MALVKELEGRRTKRLESGKEFVNDVQLLLADTTGKEQAALRAAGLSGEVDAAQSKIEMALKDREFSEKYEGSTFVLDDLKTICVKYRMFLKPAHYYTGAIPRDLGAVLARLQTKGVTLTTAGMPQLYIMAPPSLFNDYHDIGDKVGAAFEEMNDDYQKRKRAWEEARARAAELRRLDPMIFYKADDNHYVLLKKWGNDFTAFRRFMGMMTSTGFMVYAFLLTIMYYAVQLPFRAWLWTDMWVKPDLCLQWGKPNHVSTDHIMNGVENGGIYFFSHLLTFVVTAVISILTIIVCREILVSKRAYGVKSWSTKGFFKHQFSTLR